MKKELKPHIKKTLKGSQTVEMSIILPVILFVIISFMYLMFYIHDLTILRAYAYSIGLEREFMNVNTENSSTEINELFIEGKIKTVTEGRWILNECKGNINGPLVFVDRLLDDKVSENIKIYRKFSINNMYVLKCSKKFIQNKK